MVRRYGPYEERQRDDDENDEDEGGAGVREPRRPRTPAGSGALELPEGELVSV